MVRIDLSIQNETEKPIEELESPHKIRTGSLRCLAGGEAVLRLRPERGFAGVDKGIQCTLTIRVHELVDKLVKISLDFPAVGKDKWSVHHSIPGVGVLMTYHGKSAPDNAHQLRIRVHTDKNPSSASSPPLQSSGAQSIHPSAAAGRNPSNVKNLPGELVGRVFFALLFPLILGCFAAFLCLVGLVGWWAGGLGGLFLSLVAACWLVDPMSLLDRLVPRPAGQTKASPAKHD